MLDRDHPPPKTTPLLPFQPLSLNRLVISDNLIGILSLLRIYSLVALNFILASIYYSQADVGNFLRILSVSSFMQLAEGIRGTPSRMGGSPGDVSEDPVT